MGGCRHHDPHSGPTRAAPITRGPQYSAVMIKTAVVGSNTRLLQLRWLSQPSALSHPFCSV